MLNVHLTLKILEIIIKIFDSQIFVVIVWPIAVANDANFAVYEVLSISGVEKQHR